MLYCAHTQHAHSMKALQCHAYEGSVQIKCVVKPVTTVNVCLLCCIRQRMWRELVGSWFLNCFINTWKPKIIIPREESKWSLNDRLILQFKWLQRRFQIMKPSASVSPSQSRSMLLRLIELRCRCGAVSLWFWLQNQKLLGSPSTCDLLHK